MTESRKSRRKRTASSADSKTPTAEVAAAEPQWVREPRPVSPPPREGREWDRVRRISYL